MAHDALWANLIRQEKYDMAYKESLKRGRPQLFWDPLMRASTLGLLGQYEEGQKCVDNLLKLRPDFPQTGKTLIGNYIKFKEISERIVEGLQRVGLEIHDERFR